MDRELGEVALLDAMPFECLDNHDIWTFDKVQSRYREYCRRDRVEYEPLVVGPYYLERGWTAGLFGALIPRMRRGDLAAAEIGIEMVEEDRGLTFGSHVKSDIPRALARCALTERQKERLRQRVAEMLLRRFMPKEFRQYAWLVRRLGLGDWQARLEREADRSHLWVDWYLEYLTSPSPRRQPDQDWSDWR